MEGHVIWSRFLVEGRTGTSRESEARRMGTSTHSLCQCVSAKILRIVPPGRLDRSLLDHIDLSLASIKLVRACSFVQYREGEGVLKN